VFQTALRREPTGGGGGARHLRMRGPRRDPSSYATTGYAWEESELAALCALVAQTGPGEWDKKAAGWERRTGVPRSAKALMGKYYKYTAACAASKRPRIVLGGGAGVVGGCADGTLTPDEAEAEAAPKQDRGAGGSGRGTSSKKRKRPEMAAARAGMGGRHAAKPRRTAALVAAASLISSDEHPRRPYAGAAAAAVPGARRPPAHAGTGAFRQRHRAAPRVRTERPPPTSRRAVPWTAEESAALQVPLCVCPLLL
jgi:hypothetical protein